MKTISTLKRVPKSHAGVNAIGSRQPWRFWGRTSLAALVVLVVATHAEPAQAIPRNACRDLRKQATAARINATYWHDIAKVYKELGWSELSELAEINAEAYDDDAAEIDAIVALDC